MRPHLLKAVALVLSCFSHMTAEGADGLSSKLCLKTGYLILANQGALGGTKSGFAGFDLVWLNFLTERLSIGLGYNANFDLQSSATLVSGYSLQGRYYYLRPGTRIRQEHAWGSSVSQENSSPYIGSSYYKNSYYLGSDPDSSLANASLSGEYSVGVLQLGMDYRLNNDYELTGEFFTTILSFASTDSRVRLDHTGIFLGLNFIF